MKKVTFLILTLTVLFFSCKKDNNNKDWTEEDQAFYDNVIILQDLAAVNYSTWLQTLDSMEVINKLQQFFLDDSTVTSATIGGQGIAVQYSNGMRGGIFLNPQDGPINDSLNIGPPPVPSTGLNEKSLVNRKNMVLLNPSYWERAFFTDQISTQFSTKFLPKINFNLEHVYKNEEASVDRFTELSEYGIIHIYSHGWAWPKEENITDVYLMTGEEENDATTEKYALRMMLGDIFVANAAVGIAGTEKTMKNVYFINEAFVASRNDFSQDTVLFYGGFCFSFLGKWPEIQNTFAKGAYFGFDWSVLTARNADWASWLIFHLSDIATIPPRNPAIWMSMPAPEKSYEHEGRIVSINYVGDPTLTLFKDSLRVETWWPDDITQTTAEVRGIVLSEGGYPVTERGVCWSLLSNPTIADNYDYIGGGGLEVFTIALTNLTPDTIYYVRAYAINSKWTVYGNQNTFRTLAPPASTVTTAVVTNITQTTATCGGNVTSDGGVPVTARGVCWSNLPDPTIVNEHTTDGSGTGEFVSELTSLTLDTTYYVRAYATNTLGTVYGNQESFTTRPLYYIGQSYKGGIIFYLNETKKHGLICASTDQSTGAEWGCVNTLIGGTSMALGAGQANTTIIMNGCSEAGIAARICDQYSVTVNDTTYDDWYLPSLGELGQLSFQSGVIGGITPFADYWSSSEYDSYSAYCQKLSQGTVYTMAKDISWYYVRAVRAF